MAVLGTIPRHHSLFWYYDKIRHDRLWGQYLDPLLVLHSIGVTNITLQHTIIIIFYNIIYKDQIYSPIFSYVTSICNIVPQKKVNFN